jgi:predicted nuclease of restriction endonuclease-like (RecB) superfamily
MEKEYLKLIQDLKRSIVQSRYQAARLANREQLLLYYKVGKILSEASARQQWGSKVLNKISGDLQNQLPGIRGFSFSNLKKMRQFFEAYDDPLIGPLLTAQLQDIENQKIIIGSTLTIQFSYFFNIIFSHHVLILSKCKKEERLFYISTAASELWSISILEHHIDNRLFEKQGKLPNNFSETLPLELKPSALQLFNDEYLMDYLNLNDEDDERNIENKIVNNIRDFILRMGKGFSFIGNQYRLELDGEEFFIDLLFFNRILQCLVAIELKRGKFKPEYSGKLNFYLNVLDQHIKLPTENSSIGIILCKEKNNAIAEYSVKNISNPIGVATFRTTTEMPVTLKNVLPSEKELLRLL